MIVPGGGISLDGTRWVACRPNFLLAVEVCRVCFEGSSWKSLLPLIVPESCSSSASTWR
jgi:hypothetical protein